MHSCTAPRTVGVHQHVVAYEEPARTGEMMRISAHEALGFPLSCGILLQRRTGQPDNGRRRNAETAMTVEGCGASSAGRRKVLVAEDNEDLRSLMSEILTRRGMEVATVGNGAQALAAMAQDRFDAAVVDMVMPGMGGAALLDALKRAGNDTPVLVTSGYVGLLDERRFQEMGAVAVLKKPFRMEEFADAVAGASSAESSLSDRGQNHQVD